MISIAWSVLLTSNPKLNFKRLLAYYKSDANQLVLKPSSLMNFGRALADIGKTDQAIDIMKLTLNRYPSYDVYEALGDAYLSHGDTTQALQSYQKSIELYSYNQAAKEKSEHIARPTSYKDQ